MKIVRVNIFSYKKLTLGFSRSPVAHRRLYATTAYNKLVEYLTSIQHFMFGRINGKWLLFNITFIIIIITSFVYKIVSSYSPRSTTTKRVYIK